MWILHEPPSSEHRIRTRGGGGRGPLSGKRASNCDHFLLKFLNCFSGAGGVFWVFFQHMLLTMVKDGVFSHSVSSPRLFIKLGRHFLSGTSFLQDALSLKTRGTFEY